MTFTETLMTLLATAALYALGALAPSGDYCAPRTYGETVTAAQFVYLRDHEGWRGRPGDGTDDAIYPPQCI